MLLDGFKQSLLSRITKRGILYTVVYIALSKAWLKTQKLVNLWH